MLLICAFLSHMQEAGFLLTRFTASICLCLSPTCSHMSRVMRKPAFCICKNKGADQQRGNRATDQRLCFRYIDSAMTLLPKSDISSLFPSSVVVQPGLCLICSTTPNTNFLTRDSKKQILYYGNVSVLIKFSQKTRRSYCSVFPRLPPVLH